MPDRLSMQSGKWEMASTDGKLVRIETRQDITSFSHVEELYVFNTPKKILKQHHSTSTQNYRELWLQESDGREFPVLIGDKEAGKLGVSVGDYLSCLSIRKKNGKKAILVGLVDHTTSKSLNYSVRDARHNLNWINWQSILLGALGILAVPGAFVAMFLLGLKSFWEGMIVSFGAAMLPAFVIAGPLDWRGITADAHFKKVRKEFLEKGPLVSGSAMPDKGEVYPPPAQEPSSYSVQFTGKILFDKFDQEKLDVLSRKLRMDLPARIKSRNFVKSKTDEATAKKLVSVFEAIGVETQLIPNTD